MGCLLICLIIIGTVGYITAGPDLGVGKLEITAVRVEGEGYSITLTNTGSGKVDASQYSLSCNGEHPLSGELLPGKSITVALEAKQGDIATLENSDKAQKVPLPEMPLGVTYLSNNGVWGYTADIASDSFNKELLALLCRPDAEVIISEIMPGEKNGGAWVELYNATDKDIDLSKYSLHNSLERSGVKLEGFIRGGEYLVLNLTTLKDGLSLTDTLCLVKNNVVQYYVKWSAHTVPNISCSGNGLKCVYYTHPTPGEKNGEAVDSTDVTSGKHTVQINELMLKNTFGVAPLMGRRTAWAELYNSSDSDITLAGLYLSDDKDDLFKWALPAKEVKAGEYAVVFFCGKDAPKEGLMAPFELKGSSVYLTDIKSLKCQKVSAENIKENQSVNGDGEVLSWVSIGVKNDNRADSRLMLKISEVCSVHAPKSKNTDWVEIYNPTDKAVSLDGVYLTDGKKEPERYALSGSVPAKGYKVIKNSGISIAAEGEQIYLYYGGYFTDVFNVPKLLPQYTAGRLPENATVHSSASVNPYGVYLMPATQGEKNSTDILLGYADAPVFSKNGGYYENGTTLSITAEAGSKIYYTLDGSTPSEQSIPYSGEITVNKTTVVRAVCIRDGYASSPETVGTFRTGEDKHTLPVVCLSINGEDLEYVSQSVDRLDWRERAGYVEYYNESGELQTAFPAGLSIGGNGTRHYPQRTFNLHMRGAYGQSSVIYPFFKNNNSIIEYSSLSLRNCGQDTYYTRMRDAYISMAMDGTNANNAKTFFTVVYVNGKYHGLYEFKENQNEDYLASHTGCDKDTVQLVRNNTYVYNKIGKNTDIKSLIKFALETDCADDAVYQEFLTRVDEDAYTDYLIAVGFFVLNDVYNQKAMRSMDGVAKWQPILFDLDGGLGTSSTKSKILSRFFTDNGVFTPSGMKMETVIYNAFFENAGWREKFVERYAYLLNTSLSTESLLALFDGMTQSIAPEMERHCKRWHTPSNVTLWEENVEKMRNVIINRREHAIKEIKDLFKLSDEKMAQLFPNDFN